MSSDMTSLASWFGALDARPCEPCATDVAGPWRGPAAASTVGALRPPSAVGRPSATGAPAVPALTAQLLDGFRVWIGQAPLAGMPQGKSRSLFKLLLLMRRRPLSRHRLCHLLWPDADVLSARNNLHVTLHHLRRTLGDSRWVSCTDQGYQLSTAADVWLDTEHFVQHVERGQQDEAQGLVALAVQQYEAAASLYQNDLVDDGEVEPMLNGDAQVLRDRLNQALERLAALHEALQDSHACLRATMRHLQLDECNEEAHRRLMRCYARLGQPQLAERQYRSCVAALRVQFGLCPSDDTTRLYRQITARLPIL